MIRVGITERHGIAQEYAKYPPENVDYSFIEQVPRWTDKVLTSTAKGVWGTFESNNHDLLEAPLFPILTRNKWIYTPADGPSAFAYGLLGLPAPRIFRSLFFREMLLAENFKKLIFKSRAGMESFKQYPLMNSAKILNKTDVVYPAVRTVPDELLSSGSQNDFVITFVGEFFRKGGKHVVDAFEELQKKHKNIQLNIFADEKKHFEFTPLKKIYLDKIRNNKKIFLCYVSRDELFHKYLPMTDVFISPTYKETFGYALVEAMAFGLPVISTNHFAIPEIIDPKKNGILIDTEQFEFIKTLKGYTFDSIPEEFDLYMKEQAFNALDELIRDEDFRKSLSHGALLKARNVFSFQHRNERMRKIYQNAVD